MDDDKQQTNRVTLAVMSTDIKYLREAIDGLDKKVSAGYVTKDEFMPVKNIVYGMVGIVLLAVIGALLVLVVRKP